MSKSNMIRIGFLIFPDFPMACLTSMIEPLRAANEIAGHEAFSWQLISENGQAVTSSAQVVFETAGAFDTEIAVDVLFILSAPVTQVASARHVYGVLRALDRHGMILGGISGGVFPLSRSGVMEGHACSVHWCYDAAFRAEFPHIRSLDEVIVKDRRRFTVSGAAAAFDLALQMIEEALSDEIVHEVACWFQHPLMRGEGVRQRQPQLVNSRSNLPDLVARAIVIFSTHLQEPVKVEDVARQLGVSARQIERAFKKATGKNPTQYYRGMRMKAARQLVLYTQNSILEIAEAVGYASSTPLITHYKAAFGLSPQEERERMNDFRIQGHVPIPSV